MKFFTRRRARKAITADIARMPHNSRGRDHAAVRPEGVGKQEFLVALSARALESAPPETRPTYERWHRTYAEGRRVRVSDFPVTLLQDGETAELLPAVESAFAEKENSK